MGKGQVAAPEAQVGTEALVRPAGIAGGSRGSPSWPESVRKGLGGGPGWGCSLDRPHPQCRALVVPPGPQVGPYLFSVLL